MVLVDYIGIFYISEYFWQMTVAEILLKVMLNTQKNKIKLKLIVIQMYHKSVKSLFLTYLI